MEIWIDTQTRLTAQDLFNLIDPDELALMSLWIMLPSELSDAERAEVDAILARIIAEKTPSDTQVAYRWVDNKTGEVDT